MRNIIIGLLLSFGIEGIEFDSYYHWSLYSGYGWGKDRDAGFGTGITNDIGAKITLDEKNSFLLLYEMSYSGEGLKEREGTRFSDRNQDHFILFSYSRNFSPKTTLKAKLDYTKAFVRSGITESWENGLYNYDQIGSGIDFRKTMGSFETEGGIRLSSVKYPNYTYLLGEIEPSWDEPRYDHNKMGISFALSHPIHPMIICKAGYKYNLKNYRYEYIKDVSGKTTDKKQRDSIHTLSFSLSHKTFGIATELELLRSNYNEVKFSSGGTPTLVTPNYYDYNFYELSPWIRYLWKKMEFCLSFSYRMKDYTNRYAEDEYRNRLPSKQKDRVGLFLFKVSKPINPSLVALFSFGYKDSSSTMKRKDLNYKDNSLGIRLIFEH